MGAQTSSTITRGCEQLSKRAPLEDLNRMSCVLSKHERSFKKNIDGGHMLVGGRVIFGSHVPMNDSLAIIMVPTSSVRGLNVRAILSSEAM